MGDYFTKHGAMLLAARIQVYWAMLGLSGVRVWLEPIVMDQSQEEGDLYQVRSNIPEIVNEHFNRYALLQWTGNRTVH